MPGRFGGECLERRIGRDVEERPHHPDAAEVRAKHGGALLGADLAESEGFAVSPTGERDPARRPGIPHPAHLAVRRNQETLSVLDQDHRRRVCPPAAAAGHAQQVHVPVDRSSEAKQPRQDDVDQTAGGAEPIGLRHRETFAQSDRSRSDRSQVCCLPTLTGDVRKNLAVTTNYERAFAGRPEVLAAWGELNGSIKAGMDLRRYELATLAAARRLRSSYCCLAHGTVLQEHFGEPVLEIARDHHAAGLDPVDVAVMDLAERVVDDATSIGDDELRPLRDLGLSETEIMDVVLAAAARCFFSKTLDALGVLPDVSYRELEADMRKVLVVGRPIADT